jgi:hypothetical protein
MTFNVLVAGQTPFTYFWSKDGVPIQDDGHYTNSGTANLVVNNLGSTDAGLYQVVVSNSWGAATSSVVAVSVAYPPSITTQPAYTHVALGGSNNLSVAVSGIAPFGYQWFTASGRTATAVPLVSGGGIFQSYLTDNGMGYTSTPQVHFIGGSGSGASASAIVQGGYVVHISMNYPGFGYATAAPTIQIDPPPSVKAPLPNQTNATFTLPAVSFADGTNYFVVITNNYGSVTSSTVYLTVFLPPQNFSASNIVGTNGNLLSLQLSGSPYYPYILQSATNLTPPISWQSILTNFTDTNGNWSFIVSNLTAPNLYYRAFGQ